MKIRAMLLTVGTLALLMVGMAAFAPDFGGATVAAQAPTPTVSVPTTTTVRGCPVRPSMEGRAVRCVAMARDGVMWRHERFARAA